VQTDAGGAICVLANPTAGRGRHAGLYSAALAELAGAGHKVRVLTANSRAEALAACRQAVRQEPAALLAIGGDGTVHVALQAVAGTPVPFGVIPAGTGNDFAAATGTPADPVAAARRLVKALNERRARPLDLARVTGADGTQVWYGGVLGAGFDAIVNERASRMRFPRGPRRYDLAILVELLALRARRYTLDLDKDRQEFDAVLVTVANTGTYGGGMRICPDADPTDGLLDVLVAGPISRMTLVRLQPRVHVGTHITHPAVRLFQAATVRLEAPGIIPFADGEPLMPLPISITAEPGALTLLGVGPDNASA
jgi:diacylglycerol kinase (ATP)